MKKIWAKRLAAALLAGGTLMTMAPGAEAADIRILPVDTARFWAGSRFDFDVEVSKAQNLQDVQIQVNGKDAGMKWFGERIYDISPYVRGGENTIEVKVTTLMGNYIQTLKDNRAAQRFVLRRNQPYVSAGLIGPVKLYK